MDNWKNLKLFNREILDDASFEILKSIVRTQKIGAPTAAFAGAVMHVADEKGFETAINRFENIYGTIAEGLFEKSDMLSKADGLKAVELLRRCEILKGMANTTSEHVEAFRLANVDRGKDYSGAAMAMWKRLEIMLNPDSPTGKAIARAKQQSLQDHSFN